MEIEQHICSFINTKIDGWRRYTLYDTFFKKVVYSVNLQRKNLSLLFFHNIHPTIQFK